MRCGNSLETELVEAASEPWAQLLEADDVGGDGDEARQLLRRPSTEHHVGREDPEGRPRRSRIGRPTEEARQDEDERDDR